MLEVWDLSGHRKQWTQHTESYTLNVGSVWFKIRLSNKKTQKHNTTAASLKCSVQKRYTISQVALYYIDLIISNDSESLHKTEKKSWYGQ